MDPKLIALMTTILIFNVDTSELADRYYWSIKIQQIALNKASKNTTLFFVKKLSYLLSSITSKPIDIRWIKTVLSHTEKSCIVTYYRQFSMDNKINVIISVPVSLCLRPLGAN